MRCDIQRRISVLSRRSEICGPISSIDEPKFNLGYLTCMGQFQFNLGDLTLAKPQLDLGDVTYIDQPLAIVSGRYDIMDYCLIFCLSLKVCQTRGGGGGGRGREKVMGREGGRGLAVSSSTRYDTWNCCLPSFSLSRLGHAHINFQTVTFGHHQFC